MRLVAVGLAAGFFSALFGVGGGIVIVPMLLLVAGWEMRAATATSLAAVGITATAGVVTYVVHGEVEPVYALLVGVGRVRRRPAPPCSSGPRSDAFVPLRRAARRDRDPDAAQMTYALAVLLGAIAACLRGSSASAAAFCCSGLTWLGLTQLHAEATSLLAVIPTVLVGVWRQSRYGNVRWRPALVIGVASIGAAVAGAQSPNHCRSMCSASSSPCS